MTEWGPQWKPINELPSRPLPNKWPENYEQKSKKDPYARIGMYGASPDQINPHNPHLTQKVLYPKEYLMEWVGGRKKKTVLGTQDFEDPRVKMSFK